MKKIFAVLFAAMFIVAGMTGTTFAKSDNGVEFGEPGWYSKDKNPNENNQYQYFPNGHPLANSEWTRCGATLAECGGSPPPPPPPPNCPGCTKNTAISAVIAAPFKLENVSNPLGNASGGYSVLAQGNMSVIAIGEGSKFADAAAYAKGTAFGDGFAAGVEGDHFGIGASGAIAGVSLFGGGYGLGIDKYSRTCTPDFASVGINYYGSVHQINSIDVSNGAGTYAGGFNTTSASFYGSDYKFDDGKWLGSDKLGLIAGVIDAAGGSAYVGGFSFGTYIDLPGFSAAKSFTAGFSYYNAREGYVSGEGTAYHQAVAEGNNGGYGLSNGVASFQYEGTGNFGAGYTKTEGYSTAVNGPNSQTVTAYSHSQAGSMVGGGFKTIEVQK